MINNTTRLIISLMTLVIIIIMIYLVNSESFTGISGENGEIALGHNSKKIVKNSTSVSKNRVEKLAKDNMPDIGRKYIESQKNIKIGISIPSSLDKEIFGNSIKTAIYMAEGEIPRKLRYNYQIVLTDSYVNGRDKTLHNFKTLIEKEKVHAILSVGSDSISEISELAELNKTPHISCLLGGEMLENYNYTINNYPSSKTFAKIFTKEVLQKNLRLVSIVAEDRPNIIRLVSSLEEVFEKENIVVVSKDIISYDDDNYKTIASNVEKNKPEIVLLLVDDKRINKLTMTLGKVKHRFIYSSIDMLKNFHNKSLLGKTFYVASSNGSSEFVKKYRNKTILPMYNCVPNVYDAIKMLVLSFEEAGDDAVIFPNKVIANIKRIEDFKSSTGNLLSYKENFDSLPIVYEVEKR